MTRAPTPFDAGSASNVATRVASVNPSAKSWRRTNEMANSNTSVPPMSTKCGARACRSAPVMRPAL